MGADYIISLTDNTRGTHLIEACGTLNRYKIDHRCNVINYFNKIFERVNSNPEKFGNVGLAIVGRNGDILHGRLFDDYKGDLKLKDYVPFDKLPPWTP